LLQKEHRGSAVSASFCAITLALPNTGVSSEAPKLTGLFRDPAVFVQPFRLTIALIQIGAKGEVQPFETG
jgi:hypothetical protein